jgi:phosphoenolpyruvate carboxylase
MKKSSTGTHLSPELRKVVKESVRLLGEVIRDELGEPSYFRIEAVRKKMANLRQASDSVTAKSLRETSVMLGRLSQEERRAFARAYTLMLELMNACENAYRSRRETAPLKPKGKGPESIIYVLTAHPTEARAPANIEAFHEIQNILVPILRRDDVAFSGYETASLLHWIEVAWKSAIVRARKPRVKDEAEHIYSTVLREETLSTLLRFSHEEVSVFIRSWVGGDKDGHPGVDAPEFMESLQLSRTLLLKFVRARVAEIMATAENLGDRELVAGLRKYIGALKGLRTISHGDLKRVLRARDAAKAFVDLYGKKVGVLHPALADLRSLARTFPGLVVPLEFRESSDVLMAPEKRGAIMRMLAQLGHLSKGGDPRWYVRGMIISMAEDIAHVRMTAKLVAKALGDIKLPIVPLFEQAGAMRKSTAIVREMIRDPKLKAARKKYWGDALEVMVGYSDSSKESGVLPSRLLISKTMHDLDRLCRKEKVKPIFFQGSGGSVDRGGGSIQDQTAWWTEGAIRIYKATVQGEMIERSMASPEITRGQLRRIAAVRPSHGHGTSSSTVTAFANRVAAVYGAKIHDFSISSRSVLDLRNARSSSPSLDFARFLGSSAGPRRAYFFRPGGASEPPGANLGVPIEGN